MSDGDKPLEFSARDLMPDWAQETKKDESKTSAKRFGRDDDDKSGKRGRDRKGGGDRRGGDRRGGDRRGGYGGDRRGGGGRDFRGGDRRSNDRRGNDRRGGGRRDERRGGRDGFRPDPLPAGISVSIEPSEAAVNGLVRHIRETFRSFPLSDLAKMIVRERERYDLHFKAEPEKARLYQCLADKSLWLSRDEAVAHLLNSPAVKEYYAVEEVEVGAPTGNFNAIAVCGMSGTLLGPSNHHEYQKNILKLHQERFSNMSLERFKSRIRMENDEEIIEKWKEQVSRASHYRVKTGGEAAASAEPAEEAVAEEAKAEEEVAVESEVSEASEEGEGVASAEDQDAPGGIGESGTAEEAVGDDATGDEQVVEEETEAAEETAAETAEEASSEEPSADSGEEELVLKSQEELAQHFREHFAGDAVVEVSEVLVPGNISGKDLSQGLLAYVKQEGEKLRRGFPLPMIQSLCREFEKHGMRFFKRGKKALHVSAIRPRVISSAVSLSEDVQKVVDFITANPGRKVVDLLDALVEDFSKPDKSAPTEEIELSDAAKQVLSNLRWLTSEGYVLEFADTKLHIGKAPRPEGQAPAKKAKKKVGKSERREKKEAPVAEEIPEKPAGPEAEVAEGQSKAVAKDSETPEVKAPEVADSPASDPEEAASGSDEIPPEVGVVSEEEQPVDAVEEVCEEPSSANGETESGPASEEEEGATKSE